MQSIVMLMHTPPYVCIKICEEEVSIIARQYTKLSPPPRRPCSLRLGVGSGQC